MPTQIQVVEDDGDWGEEWYRYMLDRGQCPQCFSKDMRVDHGTELANDGRFDDMTYYWCDHCKFIDTSPVRR